MECLLNIVDGTGAKWSFVLYEERPDLIGYRYKLYKVKGILLKDSYCCSDIYYAYPEIKRKPPISKGTEVEIKHYWFNFYGEYFRVVYNGQDYDIRTSDIKLEKK